MKKVFEIFVECGAPSDILYKNNNSKKNYRLGLLNSDGAESRELPTLNYDMLNISLEFIKESLNDIKLVSTESCVFTIDEKWFLISIKEPTTNTVAFILYSFKSLKAYS